VIEFAQLEEMFANIAVKTKWDMGGPMLWGYFFTDRSREKLEALVPELEGLGYRFVKLFMPDLDKGRDPYFFLHVEKEEVHSPATLHARNAELYAFARLHGLDSYDGMDVGPIAGPY
jgi:hypothetical protein